MHMKETLADHWGRQTILEKLLYFIRKAAEGERLLCLRTAHPNKTWAERTPRIQQNLSSVSPLMCACIVAVWV